MKKKSENRAKKEGSAASLVPVLPINRDRWPLPPSLRAWPRGPTGTSFSPELLVPVGEPGLKAPTNRNNMGVCPLVLSTIHWTTIVFIKEAAYGSPGYLPSSCLYNPWVVVYKRVEKKDVWLLDTLLQRQLKYSKSPQQPWLLHLRTISICVAI